MFRWFHVAMANEDRRNRYPFASRRRLGRDSLTPAPDPTSENVGTTEASRPSPPPPHAGRGLLRDREADTAWRTVLRAEVLGLSVINRSAEQPGQNARLLVWIAATLSRCGKGDSGASPAPVFRRAQG